LRDLLQQSYNPQDLLCFVGGIGADPSWLTGLQVQPAGFNPYRVLGLEKTAIDEEVKKRYRELLLKLHPDTAGVKGNDFLLQMMLAAYQQKARERGWQ